MLKILQARLQQYMNWELPYVQAGFRKGRETREQIGNICWTIEKARKIQKNIYFCFTMLNLWLCGGISGKETDSQGRNVRDMGSIPGSGRSPGEGNVNIVQYSCLENPMHKGAWRATVHKISQSRTCLKQLRAHVDQNKLWTILQETGIPYNLTCLLRNLHAGQEATARTGHGTMDWFQIGKDVKTLLSPCLFNFYAESIMWMAGWMKHKLESSLPGAISITSDLQMITVKGPEEIPQVQGQRSPARW